MTITQIKQAVDEGHVVLWLSIGHSVYKYEGVYYITKDDNLGFYTTPVPLQNIFNSKRLGHRDLNFRIAKQAKAN